MLSTGNVKKRLMPVAAKPPKLSRHIHPQKG